MTKSFTLAYYPWITQGIDPAAIRSAVQVFAGALQTDLAASLGVSISVNVVMAQDVPPLIDEVVGTPNTIALLNPLGYVFARRSNPSVNVIALAARPDTSGVSQSTYRAQLYTSKKTGIRTIADVKGHSVGFGVPYSTSNFLVPAALLKSQHRLFSASSLCFLGGHDVIARAVYDGKVDVGAGHDGVLITLGQTYGYGDADDRILRLAWTDPIPSDPVVVNIPDQPDQDAVKAAILKIGQDKNVIAHSISIFWGGSSGLIATAPTAYDSLDSTLADLCLTQQDLMT
jgi:phosphonate transport system substrate-binding protein